MQKLYNLVKVSALLLLLLIQNSLQAQNCCLDCQADVKMISDKQVLLDKIEIKEGTATKLKTNLYVSYRSGNAQKFWSNLAIATAGVAVSTQLQSRISAEGNNANGISQLIPLGVSVTTLPSIWKNRPRSVPQAGLWLQHRDTRGRLTDTWEQPISSEAKNSGELLSVNIDKPLSAGTVEVYLQNGSKNPVYYWGYEAVKNIVEKKVLPPKTPPAINGLGCPSGYLPNGQGMCCSPFNGDCVLEDGGGDGGNGGGGNGNPTPPPSPQGCPSGYLPNGQGMCCQPGTNNCVVEGGGSPTTNSTSGVGYNVCSVDVYYKDYDRAAAITGATNGLTSSQDLLDLGYTLLYSIPFNCETGSTYNSEVQGIPNGTNAYEAYQEFLRRAYDYNNQNQGGSGGGGGNGGTGSGGNPDGPARVDGPDRIDRCIDDVYANFYNPTKTAIHNEFNLKYRTLFYSAITADILAWVRYYTTDFDKGFERVPLDGDWFRKMLKETFQTFFGPLGLIFVADTINAQIYALSAQEEAKLVQLDVETIRRINNCYN